MTTDSSGIEEKMLFTCNDGMAENPICLPKEKGGHSHTRVSINYLLVKCCCVNPHFQHVRFKGGVRK